MQNKVSVFLPTRAGSERVKLKNTRTFSNVDGGLLRIKLEQLLDSKSIAEIILSTNDYNSVEVAKKIKSKRLVIVERPDHLAQSTTNLTDLVKYVPSVCNSKHILWTHVTSPLISSSDYDDAIRIYFEGLNQGYDSLMSVKKIQNFIWSKKHNVVINKKENDLKKWPRTQDLNIVYEINSAIFLASRDIYLSEMDRVGITPYLLAQSQIQSTDVDWEEDFKLAEILFNHYGKY